MSTSDSPAGEKASAAVKLRCPYPDCIGSVSAGRKFCVKCRRPLALCPACKNVMAHDLGVCHICGHGSGAATGDGATETAESGPSLTSLLAKAYYTAAMLGVNMASAVTSLEATRLAVVESPNYFKAWNAVDDQIGLAPDKTLQAVVGGLRDDLVKQFLSSEVARLREAFGKDPEEGWVKWRTLYAEALNNWRREFCLSLCQEDFPFPAHASSLVEKVRRLTRLAWEERWVESYELFEHFAEQSFLPDAERAKLLVTAGEIQQYHLFKLEKAEKLFEAAERLAPSEPRVLPAVGRYWLKRNDPEKAQKYAKSAHEADPLSADAYSLMGEIQQERKETRQAEEWYQKGVRSAPGNTGCYYKLLNLYGLPELLPTHEPRLQPLIDTLTALDPDGVYTLYNEVGGVYQQNGKAEQAHEWYDKAVALAPGRLNAYLLKGYAYLEEEEFDECRAMFRKVIELAPESFDGYWGLSMFHEQQEQWEEALRAYQQSFERRADWAGLILTKIGELRLKLRDFAGAEQALFESLRREPGNQMPLNILSNLADDYYKRLGKPQDALRVYAEARRILGESYEAEYHNRLGRFEHYRSNFPAAAAAFRRAAAAAPETALYLSNLSVVYSDMGAWDEARRALEAALGIGQKPEEYASTLALIENSEANHYFSQGDFKKAVEGYEAAAGHDPKSAVYYSNLSQAWKKLVEAGAGIEALDKSIAAIRAAIGAAPEHEEYARTLGSLTAQRELALKYGTHALNKIPLVTPVAVELAPDLVPLIQGADGDGLSDEATALTNDLRGRMLRTFGVSIPGLRFRDAGEVLSAGDFVVSLSEVPLVLGTAPGDKKLFPGPQSRLAPLGVTGEVAKDPLTGGEVCWVSKEDWEKVAGAGLELRSPVVQLLRQVEDLLIKNLSEFVGHQEVSSLLLLRPGGAASEGLAKAPELLTPFTQVLRALAAEGVPITDLDPMFEQFAALWSAETELTAVAERLRSLPELLPRLPGNDDRHSFYSLSPEFETKIGESVLTDNGRPFLALGPEDCQEALQAVREVIAEHPRAALLTAQPTLRVFVRKLIELEFPETPVLCRQELLPGLEGRIAGEIALPDEDED